MLEEAGRVSSLIVQDLSLWSSFLLSLKCWTGRGYQVNKKERTHQFIVRRVFLIPHILSISHIPSRYFISLVLACNESARNRRRSPRNRLTRRLTLDSYYYYNYTQPLFSGLERERERYFSPSLHMNSFNISFFSSSSGSSFFVLCFEISEITRSVFREEKKWRDIFYTQ